MQLSAAGLFKYVWPFSGHQALKSQDTNITVIKAVRELQGSAANQD